MTYLPLTERVWAIFGLKSCVSPNRLDANRLFEFKKNRSFKYQDLRSTPIYGVKNYDFQDFATIHSAVA